MKRLDFLALALFSLVFAGCSKGGGEAGDAGSDVAEQGAGGTESGATASGPPTQADIANAQSVVEGYLTGWKNGDPDESFEFLTTTAQEEYKKTEFEIAPPARATARFKVVETESAIEEYENEDPSDDIHTIHVGAQWSDVDERGNAMAEVLVFFLRRDADRDWRIFGMALKLDPRLKPEVLNFESHKQIESVLKKTEEELARLARRQKPGRSRSLVVPPQNLNEASGERVGDSPEDRLSKKAPKGSKIADTRADRRAPKKTKNSNGGESSLVKPVAGEEPMDESSAGSRKNSSDADANDVNAE